NDFSEIDISLVSINDVLNSEQNETLPLQQSEKPKPELKEDEIIKSQNNLIPKVSISEVFEHFKVLTEMTNKYDEFYLNNEQLLIFIKSTFIDLNPIKQKFNCKGFVKKDIRTIFYKFYFKHKNKETNQTRLKR